MDAEPLRTQQFLRYLVERGAVERYGPFWTENQEVVARLERELAVIVGQEFCSYFLILHVVMDFCRRENIPYAPGRGSVGGSAVAYVAGIHEVDPLEYGLIFERFMNPERVSYPDVDIDLSQRDRQRVIDFVRETYEHDGTIVLPVGAFASAGGKSLVDHMVNAARGRDDPNADATGMILKSCLPEDLTGGTKQSRPLAFWLSPENNAAHGDRKKFRDTAEKAGWLGPMLKLDGMFTHIARHAAGVVILSAEDAQNLPLTSADKETMVTGFDMYDLEALDFLKLDLLGLRTLDVVCDADRLIGGNGYIPDMMKLWAEHRDDPEPYQMLCDADTLGIFQMETDGYRRTLRNFLPKRFDDIVHLNALYRPGAIDAVRAEDGKNMVEVFIDRRHGREAVNYPDERLVPIMRETHGIFLYQEQMMRAATVLADFTDAQADNLRRAIGKKKMKELQKLKPAFFEGCAKNGIREAVVNLVWLSFEAAARYSWNKSHSVFYAIITWWTMHYKFNHPYAFYAALFNSYEDKKERLAHALSEARQVVGIKPPDINVAEDGFTINVDKDVVFGLNGVKGLGEDGRRQILEARDGIPFGNFKDFVSRLPSLGSDKKLSLIRCGAFDEIDERKWLLARCKKESKGKECKPCEGNGQIDVDTGVAAPNGVGHDGTGFTVGKCTACGGSGRIPHIWTVAEHINHNRKLKKPRPVPPAWELEWPTNQELSQGEADVIGFYISSEPLAEIARTLSHIPKGNHMGGEVEKIYKKKDRRKQQMANLTLLTPALTRQRVRVFASVWDRWEHFIEKGKQIIVRGRMDGDTFLADAFFEPGDYRHFKHIKVKKDDDPWTQPESFDGDNRTIEELESEGFQVGLL